MLSQHFRNLISRECRGIAQILPFLGLAITCTLIAGPVFTSTASLSFRSPISPVSPIQPSPDKTSGPEKVLPPQTVQPKEIASATPTPTATVTQEVSDQPPQQVPPPLPPSDLKEEASTPPTLWVVAGLVIVGGIVAGLIVFKRK